MKSIIILCLIAFAVANYTNQPLFTEEKLRELQEIAPFEVTNYEDNQFRGWTLGDAMDWLSEEMDQNPMPVVPNTHYPLKAPKSFDAREEWPECVHAIRDQQHCGSCYAFGGANAISDRYCISGKNLILSPQDIVSCSPQYGCQGGWITVTFQYIAETGIPTDSCVPYVSGDGHVPACASKCVDGTEFKRYKCKSGSYFKTYTIDQIKDEMSNNGPVEARFDVYEDFMAYKSGVYTHVQGSRLGGHAIKCLGYGNAEGKDYWICANSWGLDWGMSGYFNIDMMTCGISNYMTGCTPNL